MERNFKPLDDKSESGNIVLSFSDSMFKLKEFITATEQAFQFHGLDKLRNNLSSRGGIPGTSEQWYRQGVDCELLKPGSEGWRKGKIRIKISLEICPDEPEVEETPEITQPESPLDDIRRMINQDG
ncbi:MAG TPA: KGK domain-containing protein [Leptolyngbyaceae cyanobacterium]